MLLHWGVRPYLVFDGAPLPAKEREEEERAQKRADARARGLQLLREGNDAAAEKRNSGRENYFVGAPPSPDATPVVAKKNISSELESASETTAAVAPSNVTPTERPGPPVATPRTRTGAR